MAHGFEPQYMSREWLGSWRATGGFNAVPSSARPGAAEASRLMTEHFGSGGMTGRWIHWVDSLEN